MKAAMVRGVAIMLLLSAAARAGEIRGQIVNTQGGEPLSRVRVSLVETRTSVVTSADGEFSFPGVAAGKYTLRVDAVGYWLASVPVVLDGPDDVKEFSITMVAEGLPRNETIEVKGDLFRPVETAGLDQMGVNPIELKSTSTLLSADPFRSVQVLPGVSSASNDDFYAEFSVLGAPFSTLAIYVDSVELRNPIQGISGLQNSASVSVFSSDTIESLTLVPTAFSERYGDGTGGALDIRTREGSRMRPHVRVSAGLLEAHGSAEGGFAGRRGSWLVSARKSYMGYILRKTGIANAPSVGFYNGDAKLTYDLTTRHTLEFYALDGNASLDRTTERNIELGDNTLTFGNNTISLARVGWRFAQSPTLVLNSRAAFVREDTQTSNPAHLLLTRTGYGEWAGGATAVWSWKSEHILEAGYDLRRLRASTRLLDYCPLCPPIFPDMVENRSHGTGLRHGAYLQQSSTLWRNRLQLTAGLRWDHLSPVAAQPVSPQVSASLRLHGGTSVQFGFGRYLQFGDVSQMGQQYSSGLAWQLGGSGWFYNGNVFPMYTRATHYLAALEHRIGEHARVRLEAFERQQDLVNGERNVAPGAFHPVSNTPYGSWQQQARGLELILQRRSANGLSGWIGYTYENVRNRFVNGPPPPVVYDSTYQFPLDQRHTVNAFASYRVKPTVNLSGKWMYGSGYPLPDWLQRVSPGRYVTPSQPSFVAMPAYARLDVRTDKVFTWRGTKLTFSAELVNATNHRNMRFLGYDNFDPVTQTYSIVLDRALPIAPTFGVTFEF